MQYFDVEAKAWKPLTSLAPAKQVLSCNCVEVVGSKLFISSACSLRCYDIERNVWKELSHSCRVIYNLCSVGGYMYEIGSNYNKIPERYNVAERRWECFAKVNITSTSSNTFCSSGATVYHSKVYALYGHKQKQQSSWCMRNAVLHCFDPLRNVWEEKASTCKPHFGSSLFVVNNKLYVAGGEDCIDEMGRQCGNRASVEVYDKQNNKWSIVEQKNIPQNNLGAVEIQRRVYFIINKFQVDSGIRIPPGEVYPVYLDEWKKLANISKEAVLCYVQLKRESFKTD